MNVYEKVERNIDELVENNVDWSACATSDENGGYYKAVNRMPYCSTDHDSTSDWVEYGHTMEDYLGGQIECGFVIDGYMECQLEDITELYFLTRAVKRCCQNEK